MYAIFTDDGIPRWFGPEPVEGSEALDLDGLSALLPDAAGPEVVQAMLRDLLATHMRQDGRWLARPAIVIAQAGDETAGNTTPADETEDS